jgi:hypothetical protein
MAKSEKTAMFLPVFLFIYKHHFLHLGFIDPLTYQMAGGKGSQPSSCQCYAMLSSMIIIFFYLLGYFYIFLKIKLVSFEVYSCLSQQIHFLEIEIHSGLQLSSCQCYAILLFKWKLIFYMQKWHRWRLIFFFFSDILLFF